MSTGTQWPCETRARRQSGDVWHATRASTLDEVEDVLETVVAAMTEAHYSEHDVFAVRLGLEEAVVNGIKHGNACDPDRQVTVRYSVQSDCVLVEAEDEGDGFDPEAVPDPRIPENLERPTGRGLLLMRYYLSWVRFSERGNRVTLCKFRSITAPTPP